MGKKFYKFIKIAIKLHSYWSNFIMEDQIFEKINFNTAICAVARPWHALLIGAISSTISISVIPALEFLKIDDPVGIIPIHLTSSIWGMCAVGIFAEDDQVLVCVVLI